MNKIKSKTKYLIILQQFHQFKMVLRTVININFILFFNIFKTGKYMCILYYLVRLCINVQSMTKKYWSIERNDEISDMT